MNLANLLGSEASTAQTYLVDAGIAHTLCRNYDVGRYVLTQECSTLNHRVVADVYPLVHSCVATDNHPVTHLDLAGKRYAVGNYAVVADNVIVCNVNVSHQQVVATYYGRASRGCSSSDGYALANVVVVANLGCGHLARELQILR